MKDFIKTILKEEFEDQKNINIYEIYEKSSLIQYLNSKTGAIHGNSKTRRSLANIYAIYSILHYYVEDFYNQPEEYKKFRGYEYTKLFRFYRGLYGGQKLQNHALNSRVNGEFKNRKKCDNENDLIIIDESRYTIHIDYLYIDGIDISKVAVNIIEEYIALLELKDNKLVDDIEELIQLNSVAEKKEKITNMLGEDSEARIFEIMSYAILKHYYKETKIYIGFSLDEIKEEYLDLYKTGRANANDGGIDFVMKPLGRFFQVTEVGDYDKYLLDMDKVLHFPITFVVKTKESKKQIESQLETFIEIKSSGMEIIKDRYKKAIEEIITINELNLWLQGLDNNSINSLLRDIDLYYKLELNLPLND